MSRDSSTSNNYPAHTHRKTLSGTGSFTISSSSSKPTSNSQELGSPLRASSTTSTSPNPIETNAAFIPQVQKPIRRSLSFQIPLKVSTDSGRFSQSRNRARSLPAVPDKKPQIAPPSSRERFSVSSIGESPLATSKPIFVAESASSADETGTPTEQFLQARGLPTTEPQDQQTVEADDNPLLEQSLTRKCSQTKTSGESDRAPQYPSGYSNGDNGAFGSNPKAGMGAANGMPAQNLPMPNLSGNVTSMKETFSRVP